MLLKDKEQYLTHIPMSLIHVTFKMKREIWRIQ